MKHCLIAILGLAVWIGAFAPPVRADLTPEEVRSAIAKAVAYLKQQQRSDGSWPDYLTQPGGVTGLCALALLNAGVSPADPALQKALNNLRKRRPQTTYVVALQTMVLCRAEPEKDQVLVRKNVEWLQRTQVRDGPRPGTWSYPSGQGDGSNAQFALLALHEAERAAEAGLIQGVEIHQDTWERARAYWEKAQNDDGSWPYYRPADRGMAGTGSMTCAGISSMVIASDMIDATDAKVDGDQIDACYRAGNESARHIERGLDWLAKNFSVELNPGQSRETWHMYYLYGLERAGRLTARRFIGNHDWYREGAEHLIRKKQDNLSGFFAGGGHAEDDRNISTSLALLFLSKGRWPVLVAKLKHGPGDEWNQRRHDIHNLTLYVESKWKQDLTWQVIELDKARIEDLLQAPVLVLSGSQSPLPDDEEQQRQMAAKIRGYIDRGGFVFAEADTCASGFDKGFRRLMELAFPEPEYKLTLLDPNHPIWHFDEQVPHEQLRPLEGINYGCRTSLVYAPRDPRGQRVPLSCLWELSRAGRRQTFSRAVQAQIKAARSIGINVLGYATNREFDEGRKLGITLTSKSPLEKIDRGRLEVAKLRHPGGCDSAPRALANLMEAAAGQLKVHVETHPKLIGMTDAALYDYPMVFMHGRNRFELTDSERKALKTYVERGGLLLADAICSSKAFGDSFRAEMKKMFPAAALARIPSTDGLWTTKYGGFDLATVSRRDPQPAEGGGPMRAEVRKVPPELEGIKFGDRFGVIFSQFDLSCALEKQDSLECRGYTREDAARLGINVLLYSVQQ
jgi:hypothetical protein